VSRDTSFYYAFLVLPPAKRSAIIAVWDFCRAVDDAVDEVVPEHEWHGGLDTAAHARAAGQLAMWRSELAAIYTGTSRTRQGKRLEPYVQEFRLPRERFDELIDGVAMDLATSRYETFDALSLYCRRVASAVGLICLEIFGYRDPAARAYAENLGIALQLTNIIRDIAGDLRRGRVYLPSEDLARFGVTEGELKDGMVTPRLGELLRFECVRAREYYARAARHFPRGDARNLVAAEIMGAIYFEILRRIERSGYDVFSRRIRVPRPYRAVLAMGTWARALIGARPPWYA
jgi:phytoene synthase